MRKFSGLLGSTWRSTQRWIASERLRRLRTRLFQVYVLIALLAFAALAFLANTVPVFQPDVHLTLELQEDLPRLFGPILQAVSWPGYFIPSILVTTLVVLFLAVTGLRWEALSTVFAAVSSVALNYLVKVAIHRPRPTADLVNVYRTLTDYSFPSGHVMFYTAFFGFLLFLTFTLLKRIWLRYLLITILLLLIALVGVSRMYLGEHWASDVIGGYLLGSLVLISVISFYHWGKVEKVVQQPVAVTGREENDVPTDENKEVQETLKNPLLPKKQVRKDQMKQ